jgi:hypothetical protein
MLFSFKIPTKKEKSESPRLNCFHNESSMTNKGVLVVLIKQRYNFESNLQR